MECKTNHDQETSHNRRLPLSLRRHGNPARQVTRNGEEEEHDARDDQDSRDEGC
jgi:hypothetical protein